MPKRSQPGDEEEKTTTTTTSKKRKSLHEDAAASEERSAPPKKKIKETTEEEEEEIETRKKTRSTPSRNTPSRSAAKRGKAAHDKDVLAVTQVKETTIRKLRVENLRIPSHQTPGKHPVGVEHDLLEVETKLTRPPRMRLNLENNTSDKKSTAEEEETRKDQLENEEEKTEDKSNKVQESSARASENRQETNVVEATEPIPASHTFWKWGPRLLQVILLLYCRPISNRYMNWLKGNPQSAVIMEREISPAELEATERIASQVQLLDFNMARLKKGRDGLYTDLPHHQQLVAKLSELTASASAPWTDRLEGAIQSVEKFMSEDQALSSSTMASIRALLGPDVAEYLLDLEHIQLWNISTNLTECGQTDSLTEGRVLDAQRQLLLDLQEETSKLVNDKQVEKAVVDWFLRDTDRFTEPIEVQSASASNVPRGSSMDSIRKVIQSRMDVVSADLTGKVDYAAITAGGIIIKTGTYATTASIVDSLPYGNRLLHTLRLRFYGHGPEAAIMPTYPIEPSKALGNCWSFLASPSELGKYAVFSVSLANPIYATQVAIEHPPREVNDRANAAIRSFRVVGFESADATGKAWEMGKFEYRLGDEYLQVFDLEEEMGNADIPAIQSLSLLIDSNWGLAYSCLYRLRVHGHQVEDDS